MMLISMDRPRKSDLHAITFSRKITSACKRAYRLIDDVGSDNRQILIDVSQQIRMNAYASSDNF